MDGIAQLRNTPRADGYLPCQVVFGRSIRTIIPTLTEALGTNYCVEKARGNRKRLDHKRKRRYDANAKDLKPFDPSTMVWVQNCETGRWDDKAEVLHRIRNRTYKLQFENGRHTFRNRRRIRKRHLKGQLKPTKEQDEVVSDNSEALKMPVRRGERAKKKNNHYSSELFIL